MSNRSDIREALLLKFRDFHGNSELLVVSKKEPVLKKGLWVLFVAKKLRIISGLTPSEIEQIGNLFRLGISRQAIIQSFDSHPEVVIVKKVTPKRVECEILPEGEGLFTNDVPTLLEAGNVYTSMKVLRETLKKAKGYLRILDPYVEAEVLDALVGVPKDLPIELLTANTGGDLKSKTTERDFKRFAQERGRFEARKKKDMRLHDRYILTNDMCYLVGSSLKDIGRKTTMIVPLPDLKNQIESLFKNEWAQASIIV